MQEVCDHCFGGKPTTMIYFSNVMFFVMGVFVATVEGQKSMYVSAWWPLFSELAIFDALS